MAPGQDWCLDCGMAAPGRLGQRPGWRAAVTVVGLTLLLAAGAAVASYAALSDDANRDVSKPTVANVTPVTPQSAPPPATSTPATAPATGAKPPSAGAAPATPPPALTLPKVVPPVIAHPPSVPPASPTPTNTPTTKPTTPATPTKPVTPSKPTKHTLQPISLGADAATLYDPYNRATDKGDPADAYDNDPTTSWFVTTAAGPEMGVGLDVDLGSAQGVKVIQLATSTPGYRVEVYGATKDLPPDILDTRWSHITNRSKVDQSSKAGNKPNDGKERIVLGAGTHRYRHILLWFTTPPTAGPTVRISELSLLA